MRDNYINNNKIKENKYKILRMSLILGSDDNREETLTNFEESAREIDAMNDETYLKDLEDKFYDTLKLEEEEKKLAVLVDYIGGRVEQRISLLSDFANITGYDLSNLPPIKYYDKLDDYKERLKYIREYLSNTEQITKLTKEIEDAENKLKEAYVNKATSEECNTRNEEILLSKFTNLIKTQDQFKEITQDNIDEKLNEIINGVTDSKKSLDIFVKSYTTLKGSGIPLEEEMEYKSYVDNAKEAYYTNKEQEYLLRIYKLLLQKESEYKHIITKREEINNILYERLALRKELQIEENDILSSLYDLLERQYDDIERQKINIESIEYLNELIQNKKDEKNELDQDNQKVEILSLLREFCIIDTYSDIEESNIIEPIEEKEENKELETKQSEESVIEENESTKEEEIIPISNPFISSIPTIDDSKETKIEEPVKDNQVIAVEPATNIDLELIQSKAGKVMKRVGEMLGIKTEETKIVSVENKDPIEEPTIPTTEIPTPSTKQPEEQLQENQLSEENPLFNNNIKEIENYPADPEDDNNFWFSSDMPDALNELPDLEISNDNFFGNNNSMPDLNFPDLKLDFEQSNTEEK